MAEFWMRTLVISLALGRICEHIEAEYWRMWIRVEADGAVPARRRVSMSALTMALARAEALADSIAPDDPRRADLLTQMYADKTVYPYQNLYSQSRWLLRLPDNLLTGLMALMAFQAQQPMRVSTYMERAARLDVQP